jgi:hypothetical protein
MSQSNTTRDVGLGLLALSGMLALPPNSNGLVVVAHGSGSNRLSPRSRQANPPRTTRISLEAAILRDEPEKDRLVTVTDAVLALGATMAASDPRLEAESRVELLSDLSATALDTGLSRGERLDAQYSLTFDEAANRLLHITVMPAGRVERMELLV